MASYNGHEVRTDSLHYKGDVPDTKPYSKRGKRILIIKLGALGDAIRTTPIIRKLKKEFENCEIYWLSYSTELLPDDVITLEFNAGSLAFVMADKFDIAYNFDKDKEACAILNLVKADLKKGFYLKDGRCEPTDKDSYHKFLTGIDDDLNKKNKKSYPEEIFEMASLKFNGEKYLIKKISKKFNLKLKKPIIGLNTGCGPRWKHRKWPEERWVELTKLLQEQGCSVLLLGGKDEHDENMRISEKTGAHYLGFFPLEEFCALIDEVDLVVTAVTMGLHIAVALDKKIVLFNNAFNSNEFELYGLGKILKPQNCECFYKKECRPNCMSHLSAHEVMNAVREIL